MQNWSSLLYSLERHRCLFSARRIQSRPSSSVYLDSFLMLSCYLHLRLPRNPPSFRLSNKKFVCIFLSLRAAYLAHLASINLIILASAYTLRSSSLCFCVTFRNMLVFYGTTRPTPKQGDHPLSAVRDCLFMYSHPPPVSRDLTHPEPGDAPYRGDYGTVDGLTLLFWVVTPCELLGRYQRFGDRFCLHYQDVNVFSNGFAPPVTLHQEHFLQDCVWHVWKKNSFFIAKYGRT